MRRYLKVNDSCRVPKSLLVIGHTLKHAHWLSATAQASVLDNWHAIYTRRERGRWTRKREFSADTACGLWQTVLDLCNPYQTLTIVSHNAGELCTVTGLWDRIDRGEWSQRWCPRCGKPAYIAKCCGKSVWRGRYVTSDPPTIIGLRNSFGMLKILDIQNYFDGYVAKDLLAETRCRTLWRLLSATMDAWEADNCGVWQDTVAGNSFTSWRHTIEPKTIIVDDNPEQLAMSRRAYFAGRCEAYFVGEYRHRVHKIDATSFYPSIMIDNAFPVAFREITENCSIEYLKKRATVEFPIADVRLIAGDREYPYRHDGRIIYATGHIRTTLAWPELQIALRDGSLIRVESVAWYSTGRPFERWVSKFWQRRVDAKAAGATAIEKYCKSLLNSLSGKFGAWSTRWKDIDYANPPSRWCEWYEKDTRCGKQEGYHTDKMRQLRSRAGWVQEMTEPVEGRDSIPSIAAAITSYGRVIMDSMRRKCPFRSCLYQNTDSLIVNDEGLQALLGCYEFGSGQLGSFRVQHSANSCFIHARNDYTIGKERVISGVKCDAKQIESDVYRQTMRQKLPSILRQYPQLSVVVSEIDVKMVRENNARLLTECGWTEPHEIKPF